ncbi:MAG: hypothetical protein JSS11_07265 [Verrucomicrobia bacterium]|nr:hypothetical protein [Verrucomicrobiota bacterium]
MKKVLVSLLVLSLAGNLALALFSFGPLAPSSSAVGSASSAASGSSAANPGSDRPGDTAAAAAGAAKGFTWSGITPTSDLHTMVAQLRAAGFPPKAITALLYTVLSERMAASDPTASLPFWQRNNPPKKIMQERQAAYKAMRDQVKELVGSDTGFDPAGKAQQAQRYGNISDAKAEAIRKIESDYSEIRQFNQEDDNGMMTPERAAARRKQWAMIEQEQHADLAAVLTPEELQQYDMRNSSTAATVMRNLRNIDVNEQEYTALYTAQKAFDDANSGNPNSPEGYAQRNAAQAQLRDQMQAILGDDRFYTYLAKTDFNYARTQEFTAQFPTLTPANTYALSKLAQEVQAKMTGTAGQPMSPADRAALLADYSTRVTNLLGPDATEAYKKSNIGRWLNQPARRPSPPASPSAGQ